MKNISEFLNECLVVEAEETIKDEKSFREAARAKFEEVFGDELDEEKMNKTIDGLLEDNKDVFKRALNASLPSNNNIILDILNGGFEEIDNNIKKCRKDIIYFLNNMYPTENFIRKTDVDIIEYMMELQEIYKKYKK